LALVGVAKAPQLAAIARETITNVCLRPHSDIKFVQRAWETGKAAKTAAKKNQGLKRVPEE
jgi:hypothetical protein